MRERYRAQVRDEVKQAALRQLAASGPAGLSVAAIGKQRGVSGPALYRYFAGRDELLTELVINAYHDPADAPRRASPQACSRAPEFEALARAYRSCPATTPHAPRPADASQAAMNPHAPAKPGVMVALVREHYTIDSMSPARFPSRRGPGRHGPARAGTEVRHWPTQCRQEGGK
jgi:AcrR family transcriptional regulator